MAFSSLPRWVPLLPFKQVKPLKKPLNTLTGVSENIIERHEDSANLALAGLLTLGLASLSALYLTMFNLVLKQT